MTWPVARAVLLTAFLCAAAAYVLISRRDRRREGLPSRHPSRACYQMSPLHPDHPGRVKLSGEDRGRWEAIEAGLLGDIGLAIFDSEDGSAP